MPGAFALLLVAACAPGAPSPDEAVGARTTAEMEIGSEAAAGDWVREEYVVELERSRDPERALASVDASEPALLRIAMTDSGPAWLAVLNFHEGVWATVASTEPAPDGQGERVVFSREFETPLLAGEHQLIHGQDRSTMIWVVGHAAEQRRWSMRRVTPSVERWAARVVLGGAYADAAGRPFVFRDDGILDWAGQEHRYRVHLDMVGVECPFFEAEPAGGGESSRVVFGFRREADRLLLYDAGRADDPLIRCEGRPLAVLTPR